MFPTLFQFGPITIQTYLVVVVLAILTMGYSWWQRSQEEHYDDLVFFDGFWQAIFFGLLVSRTVYVVFHFSQFGLDPLTWFDIFSKPGISYLGWVMGASFFMYRFAGKQKWQPFEILDFWVRALSLGAVVAWTGFFIAGVEYGSTTTLPWGWQFPGLFDTRHPSQLYAAAMCLALTLVLNWAEFRYRSFEWYKGAKNVAQPGFVLGAALFLGGFGMGILSLFTPHKFQIGSIGLDPFLYPVLALLGMVLILVRAGYLFPNRDSA